MTTPTRTPATTTQGVRRVGLWGATASGKSTFLSALFIAAARSPEDLRVRGNNDDSTSFLVRNTHALNDQHVFPPPTQISQDPLSWTLQMWVPNPIRGRFFRSGPAMVPFDFRVDLQDAPGGSFEAVRGEPSRLNLPGSGSTAAPEVDDFLASCQGLLLLIDPIREGERGDAHKFFHGTLLRIAQRVEVPPGQRLPHYIAVCVTKFDQPKIFRFALENGFLSYSDRDPVVFPRVHNSEAERFITELFTGSQLSDVDLVRRTLGKYFYPERIQYFVTSAIGFYVGPSGEFREADYANVVPAGNGQYQIRGQIHPINVAEPLLWLGRRIAAEG